ncbi:MAG: hypothetical protein ACN4GR_13885 [Arenicellales bacterium]
MLHQHDNCEFSKLVYVHGKARLAGNGYYLTRRRNAVRGCRQAYPESIPVVSRNCVQVLDKGMAISFTLRLAAEHHRNAEPVMITLMEH